MKETRWIKVRVFIPAKHCWNNAPDEVKYLKYPHIHTFRITVQLEVFKLDREVEFFIFKEFLYKTLAALYLGESSFSCENICEQVHDIVEQAFPRRRMKIEVSETEDEGAIIEYEK